MSFFSFEFVAAFVALFILYWLLQKQVKYQNLLLICANYLFLLYADIWSAAILFVYSSYIYVLGNVLLRYFSRRLIYGLLVAGVTGCFAIFKYYNFFQESVDLLFQRLHIAVNLPLLNFLLPLGLSFYIFHSVSYVVSRCREQIPPASFSQLLLYLSFFPSIVAGPINRAEDFLPQIQAPARQILHYKKALLLMTLSVIKLFWLSSWLSVNYVNPVFDVPDAANSGQALVAVYAYAWNIYLNFSGYTDLVTGIALLLGFVVPVNFNAPYLAHNVTEFWRRWHISLSGFIRDYIYIPLGGNRKGNLRKNCNVIFAMVLSGLWHGAALNFMIWGAIHGVGVALLNMKHDFSARLFPAKLFSAKPSPEKPSPAKPFSVKSSASGGFTGSVSALSSRIITFHFVCLAWIFFRSATPADAFILLKQLVTGAVLASWAENRDMLILLWVLFLCYPWLIKLQQTACHYIQCIPWYFYPLPLSLLLTVAFSYAPDGVPGFIYAGF